MAHRRRHLQRLERVGDGHDPGAKRFAGAAFWAARSWMRAGQPARDLQGEFGERARAITEQLEQQLEAVFGPDGGHLPKELERLFSDEGFAIVEKYPELKGVPVIIGESDPEGCAACSSRITCMTALISARCVNACGKLPSCRPERGSISSP